MWWTLLKKEFAESIPFGVAACLGPLTWVGFEVWSHSFWRKEIASVPFLDKKMHVPLLLAGFVLALGMAARQVVIEDHHRNFHQLLALPARLREVFGAKMVAGLVVFVVSLALPVVVYALWAGAPGTQPGPFEWSMLALPGQVVLTLPILYFGFFLTFVRPAHWLGTKLLPLVPAVVVAAAGFDSYWWWPWGLLFVVLAEALYAANILWAAQARDY